MQQLLSSANLDAQKVTCPIQGHTASRDTGIQGYTVVVAVVVVVVVEVVVVVVVLIVLQEIFRGSSSDCCSGIRTATV